MKLLLDTHALLWAAVQPSLLSARASAMIQDETNDILVSAASVWEIATKVRLGKLPAAIPLERDLLTYIDRAGYSLVAITAELALRAGRLPGAHGDPFDRMIVAHGLADDIPIISVDAKLDSFGVRRLW